MTANRHVGPPALEVVTPRGLDSIAPLETLALPFTVRVVRTEEHLSKAIGIRAETYSRHHPDLARNLEEPEAADRSPFSLVLLAESKADGSAVGTMRIETNTTTPHFVESLLPANSRFTGRTIAFVTRLGVYRGANAQLVKLAIFKALYRYCLACQIDWIIVAARAPMDRQYLKLSFTDVYPDGTRVQISNSGQVPARLLALETITAEQEWRSADHPLYGFMIKDFTPDIAIFSSVSGTWARSRTKSGRLPSTAALDEVFGITVV